MEKMNRRKFLKASGASATALAFGGTAWRVGGVWWDQPPASEFRVLSPAEVRISDAIADAIFPGEDFGVDPIPSGTEAGVTQFLDEMLAEVLDEVTANAVRLLLHAIDEMAIFTDWRLARFHRRPLEQRVALLRAWEESYFSVRRGAFSAIKLFMSMGYCENPRVLSAMGIHYTCGGLA